jgi:3-hydroxyacyl-[acyl-carrier-protein] dehydratase
MTAGEAALAIARDHPAYAGHFPGRPILPGVVLLAEVMAAVGGGPWDVSQAKFLGVVEPGDALSLRREPQSSGGVRFEVHSPRGLVASGVLVPRP